jgi:hypothetical protein
MPAGTIAHRPIATGDTIDKPTKSLVSARLFRLVTAR